VQLGELQSQIERFNRRGVQVIALSIDPADDSLAMIERLGLSFDVASDPNQRVIQMFRVQNPDTKELALHAVYIVDQQGEVLYRKVGRRRPTSSELIDAIDVHRGDYPQTDRAEPRQGPLNVAYPQNNFQALLEISAVDAVPQTIDKPSLQEVMALVRAGRSDDAVFAFRRLIENSSQANRQALYDTAAWMTREVFIADKPNAIAAGTQLSQRLARVQQLDSQHRAAADDAEKDELLHQLARARAGLSVSRADISKQAKQWNLRYAKTMLRSYRELARAGTESQSG
jgi:hypothetical protein